MSENPELDQIADVLNAAENCIPEKDPPTQQEIEMCKGDMEEARRINRVLVNMLGELHYEAVTCKFMQIFGADHSIGKPVTPAHVFEYVDICISQKKGLDPKKINAFREYLLDMKAMIKRTWKNI